MTASTHHIVVQRYHRGLCNLPMDRVGLKNAMLKSKLAGYTYGHIVEDTKSDKERSLIRKDFRNKVFMDKVMGFGAVVLVLILSYAIASFIF